MNAVSDRPGKPRVPAASLQKKNSYIIGTAGNPSGRADFLSLRIKFLKNGTIQRVELQPEAAEKQIFWKERGIWECQKL